MYPEKKEGAWVYLRSSGDMRGDPPPDVALYLQPQYWSVFSLIHHILTPYFMYSAAPIGNSLNFPPFFSISLHTHLLQLWFPPFSRCLTATFLLLPPSFIFRLFSAIFVLTLFLSPSLCSPFSLILFFFLAASFPFSYPLSPPLSAFISTAPYASPFQSLCLPLSTLSFSHVLTIISTIHLVFLQESINERRKGKDRSVQTDRRNVWFSWNHSSNNDILFRLFLSNNRLQMLYI